MKIKAEQLAQQLKTQLHPVYLIAGDEILLQQESAEQIRNAAREQGFSSRQRYDVNRSFDWNTLATCANELSLFAEREIIELHIPNGKPGTVGSKAIKQYLASPPEDKLLLIITGKLEASQQKSAWVKAIENIGIYLPIWPVSANQLPRFILERAKHLGLQLDMASAQLLAERTEGNLLACQQELEKLRLIHGENAISQQDVLTAVTDSARYSVFELVDAALLGDCARSHHILNGLLAEGIEATLVLWALTRELRQLVDITHRLAAGENFNQIADQLRIWQRHKPVVQQACQRRPNPLYYTKVLQQAQRIDAMIKGTAPGDKWQAIQSLLFAMAGKPLKLRVARRVSA